MIVYEGTNLINVLTHCEGTKFISELTLLPIKLCGGGSKVEEGGDGA